MLRTSAPIKCCAMPISNKISPSCEKKKLWPKLPGSGNGLLLLATVQDNEEGFS